MKRTIITDRKTCGHCRENLPLDHFGRDVHNRAGMNCVCKKCRRARSREWVILNPEKAARKSARDIVIREHGRDAVTEERMAAKMAELAAGRERNRRRNEAHASPFQIPAGTHSRQTLCEACGISLTLLMKHRRANTAGIEDAMFRFRRVEENSLVLFHADKAEPFIAFMNGRKLEPSLRWPRGKPGAPVTGRVTSEAA